MPVGENALNLLPNIGFGERSHLHDPPTKAACQDTSELLTAAMLQLSVNPLHEEVRLFPRLGAGDLGRLAESHVHRFMEDVQGVEGKIVIG